MRALRIPDPATFTPEGSEVGEVVSCLRSLNAALKREYPAGVKQLQDLLEQWEIMALAQGHYLQLAAEAVLDGEKSAIVTVGTNRTPITVEYLGDTPPVSDCKFEDYWVGPAIPALKMTIGIEESITLITGRDPLAWKATVDDEAKTERIFAWDEWDDYPRNLGDLIVAQLPKPLYPIFPPAPLTLEGAYEVADACEEIYRFRGIGRDEDTAVIRGILQSMADELDDPSLQLLARIPVEVAAIDWRPKTASLGEYSVHWQEHFALTTPDGKLTFDESGWRLDKDPVEPTDERFARWLEETDGEFIPATTADVEA